MAGSSTTRSAARAAARSQISDTIRRSVSTGRWGPWSSKVATGTRATRPWSAARRTSGQVRRSYRNGPVSDHTGQVHLLIGGDTGAARRHPHPSQVQVADHREHDRRRLVGRLLAAVLADGLGAVAAGVAGDRSVTRAWSRARRARLPGLGGGARSASSGSV